MAHTATGLKGAWAKVMQPVLSDAERQRKASEDFKFMVLCAAKGNMAMYDLFRDRDLDPKGKAK